jgi:hypothetical protein
MSKVIALVLSSIAYLSMFSGCTTRGRVWLRPDGSPGPQDCPEESKKALRYMNLHVGDSAELYLDVNQAKSRRTVLHDGPIESVLLEKLGPLTKTSRLYGQVWISGPQVVVRYYEAQPPEGKRVPFCAVARFGGDDMQKLPESLPGTAVLRGSNAFAFVVDEFL